MSDKLQQLMTEYAELRRAYVENTPGSYTQQPLTHEQRMVALHDSVPAMPDPRLWSPDEYAEKLAEYNQRIGYKLSSLGNYGTGDNRRPAIAKRTSDPEWEDYLARRRAENELNPEYGILRRMVEKQREALPAV